MTHPSPVYAYIVGQNFMEKKFDSATEAFASLKKLQNISHNEKTMWVVSERKLSDKEQLMLNVVQAETD